MEKENIYSFFQDIKNKVLFSFNDCKFEPLQLSLLKEGFNLYTKKSETNLYSNSLSIFYFIVKNYQKKFDEQAVLLGGFCTLYVLSLDLFDDVQDDDLNGKPYENVGIPIAVNNAITLLFLSIKFLSQAIELEKDITRKSKYLEVFNKATILAVKGQHKDLMGIEGATGIKDVLDMQKEKASSMSMIAQCAAIFSGCNDEQIEKYRNIAEKMVLIFQIVDDFRDIYGKKISPDLTTDKFTFPIASFFESANEEQIIKFNELKRKLPESIKDIRKLLYENNVLSKSAETIEGLRKTIYKDLASIGATTPSIRTLLNTVDSFASTLYKLPFLEESKIYLQPHGFWHDNIKNLVNSFFKNMGQFNPPEKPVVIPWHLPQWMYDFKRNVIFYSDIEGQPEEIIPIHSKITGIADWDVVKNGIEIQSPFLMAHEIFHYWRKQSGKITDDYWYEEWVANNLAMAYIKTFLPELVEKTKTFLQIILSNPNFKLTDKGNEILDKLFTSNYKADSKVNYHQMDLEEIGYIQVYMTNKLLSFNYSLNEVVEEFL